MYNAIEIANAFNQQNDKKSWKAKATTRQVEGAAEYVHFTHNGMVTLLLNCNDGRFQIKFNKYQGAWGDYIGAIARGLFVVCTTLKSAGLPFNAPATPDGAIIEAVNSGVGTVHVRFVENKFPI